MAGYQVNPAELTCTAEEIRTLASEPGRIRGHLDTADVPPQSWGLLGLSLGMYDSYRVLLTSLSRQLDAAAQQFTELGDNLHATAEQYRNSDRAAKDAFDGIGRERDSAAIARQTGNPGFAPEGIIP